MCVRVGGCVSTHLSVYICVCVKSLEYVCLYVGDVSNHSSVCMYVCICGGCRLTRVCMCVCMCMYVYVLVYMYACVYVCGPGWGVAKCENMCKLQSRLEVGFFCAYVLCELPIPCNFWKVVWQILTPPW